MQFSNQSNSIMKIFSLKRIVSFIILLVFTIQFAVAQKKDPGASPQALHDMYMEQATKKRIIGWTMFGGGLAFTLGGVAKSMSPTFKGVPKTDPRLIWLPAVGIISTIGSIPMLMSAKKLDRKADMILKGDNAFISPNSNWSQSYPAIGLRIYLK